MPKEKYKTVSDKRMMEVLSWYKKDKGLTQNEACDVFDINSKMLSSIRSGRQSFTKEHVENMIKHIKNLNANYIFGKDDSMFTISEKTTLTQLLKLALKIAENK